MDSLRVADSSSLRLHIMLALREAEIFLEKTSLLAWRSSSLAAKVAAWRAWMPMRAAVAMASWLARSGG